MNIRLSWLRGTDAWANETIAALVAVPNNFGGPTTISWARRNLAARTLFPAVEESMTAVPKKTELERQALMLETACDQLLLRPQDALAREHLARTIAAATLATEEDDSTS